MRRYNCINALIAATFTPFDASGNVNITAIDHYADHILNSGISGVFVCGTTGEFASLTTEERKAVLEKWLQALKGKVKVIAHVGSNSQNEAIELSQHALYSGADAVAAIAPSFFKPASNSALIDFFIPIASAANEIPFYYYHMPSITGVHLSVNDFLKIGSEKIQNLAGVKYTHTNLMEMAECIHNYKGQFEILHGYDEMLICGLTLGTNGAVGSTYNYAADIYLKLINEMQNGNIKVAREMQMKSIEIVKTIIKYGGGVRGGKAIMKIIGIECGSCRLPVTAFGNKEYEMLRNDLKKIKFLE